MNACGPAHPNPSSDPAVGPRAHSWVIPCMDFRDRERMSSGSRAQVIGAWEEKSHEKLSVQNKLYCSLTEGECAISASATYSTLDQQAKTRGNLGKTVIVRKGELSSLKDLKEHWHRRPEH